MKRNRNLEQASDFPFFHADGSALGFQDPPGQIKSHAGAFRLHCLRRASPVKTLENSVRLLGRNPDALVLDFQQIVADHGPHADFDGRVFLGIFHRVV